MKRLILLFLLIVTSFSSIAQELNGVWMSYNTRIVDKNKGYSFGLEGMIIDFDKKTLGHISSDTVARIGVKRNKLKIKGAKGKLALKVFGNDSIETPQIGNTITVFHKLELEAKPKFEDKEIISFLTQNKFDSIYGFMEVEFSNDQYWIDKRFEKKEGRKNFVNHTWEDAGYWYLKNINDHYFLVLTLSQIDEKHIFQIMYLNEKRMTLKPLQDRTLKPAQLTELKIRM